MKLPTEIRTDRLVIAPFTAADAERFVAFMTDAEATRFLFRAEQKTPSGAREFLEQIIESYATETPYFVYAMRAGGEPGFVGSCGTSGLPYDGIYELFCGVLPAHRRNGYASEAARGLADYCFANYHVSELRAYVAPENPAGPGLASRLGMRSLGTGEHPVHGSETHIYALRRGEERRQ